LLSLSLSVLHSKLLLISWLKVYLRRLLLVEILVLVEWLWLLHIYKSLLLINIIILIMAHEVWRRFYICNILSGQELLLLRKEYLLLVLWMILLIDLFGYEGFTVLRVHSLLLFSFFLFLFLFLLRLFVCKKWTTLLEFLTKSLLKEFLLMLIMHMGETFAYYLELKRELFLCELS